MRLVQDNSVTWTSPGAQGSSSINAPKAKKTLPSTLVPTGYFFSTASHTTASLRNSSDQAKAILSKGAIVADSGRNDFLEDLGTQLSGVNGMDGCRGRNAAHKGRDNRDAGN